MLQLQNTLTIGDIITLGLLILTFFAVILTYLQIKANSFKELYLLTYNDPAIRRVYSQIQYEKFNYDEDHFQGNEAIEKAVDRTLSVFNLISHLYHQGFLTKHEMKPFRYMLLRVYQNPGIGRYMAFLEVVYLTEGLNIKPFESFRSYCEKEQFRYHDLTVDQACWFYKEQKNKLDSLIAVAEKQFPKTPNENNSEYKLRILTELKNCFKNLDKPHEDISYKAIYEAIEKKDVYDPDRIIIGLEAYGVKLLMDENKELPKSVDAVPSRVSVEHLYKKHIANSKNAIKYKSLVTTKVPKRRVKVDHGRQQ